MGGYILILANVVGGLPIEITHHNEAFARARACKLLRSYNCDIAVYELPSLRHVETYTHKAPDRE